MTLNRVGVASCARVLGAVHATVGLIIGLFVTLAAILGFAASALNSATQSGGAAVGALMGVGAILIFPIFFGLGGALTGAFYALVYNTFARMVGGIELELEWCAAVLHATELGGSECHHVRVKIIGDRQVGDVGVCG